MKFDRLWPKLRGPKVGTLITTIRHADKYNYWKSREGKHETIFVRGRRWGAVRIHGVELRRFDSLHPRLLRLDTRQDWDEERVVALFKSYYPGFTTQDKVTLIWMEVIEYERSYKNSNQWQSLIGQDDPSQGAD